MSDRLTSEQRSWNMSRIKNKDTSIEIKLRKALWGKGVRYRKNVKDVYGKPDIAIKKYKLAIFCDSSFFHGRDYDTKKKPGTNTEFWDKKIRRNMERDKEVNNRLREDGWIVLRFWDTEIDKETDKCIEEILVEIEKQEAEKQ